MTSYFPFYREKRLTYISYTLWLDNAIPESKFIMNSDIHPMRNTKQGHTTYFYLGREHQYGHIWGRSPHLCWSE